MMSTYSDCLIQRILVQSRQLNAAKLKSFIHSSNLVVKSISQLGWTKKLSDVVLDAYCEFIELKIVVQDWTTSNIVPSWCIRQVWKLHALSNKKEYEEACKRLCGKLIQYQIEVKQDPDSPIDIQCEHISFTKQVYQLRFNHTINGAVWEFHFNSLWKSEYQKRDIAANIFYGNKKKEKVLKKKEKKILNNKEKSVKIDASANTVDTQHNHEALNITNSNKTENNTSNMDSLSHSNNQENLENSQSTNNAYNNTNNLRTDEINGSSSNILTNNTNSPIINGSIINSSDSQNVRNETGASSSQGSSSNNNGRINNNNSSNSGITDNITNVGSKRKRSRLTLEVKDPVVTRSRAKRLRLTL